MNQRPRIQRAVAASASLLIVMLAAQQARADDTADEADLHFAMGAEHYAAKDYRHALEHFLISNRLVPNRNVVYNIARSYEQLQLFPDAHRYYTQALVGETDSDARNRIEVALARVGANVALLDIQTDPPGATVYLDRKDLGPRGDTPRKLGLSPGRYSVIVELKGYEPARAEAVSAEPGVSKTVRLSLKQILGNVQVIGDPAGATVHLDDDHTPAVCTTPCTFDAPPGRHALFFRHERYQAAVQQVEVTARGLVTVRPRMDALKGALLIDADERDAMVEVDGKTVGLTPSVVNLTAGQHKLRVSLAGYRPIERTVVVQPNQQTKIEVELRQVEEVTAASRAVESVEDAPSSVSVLPSAELRAFAYPTVWEAMRGMRGVYASDDRAYATLGMRGFSPLGDFGNRILILADGHPTNDNMMGASYPDYTGWIGLEDIDRLEVVRGPGSVLYGTNAFSGVINVVTRHRDVPPGVEVGVSTSDYGAAKARARVNLRLGKDAGMWVSVAGVKAAGRDFYFPEYAEQGGWARGVDGFQAGTISGRVWWKQLTAQWHVNTRLKHVPTAYYGTILGSPFTRNTDTRGHFETRYEPKLSEYAQLLARGHINFQRYVTNAAFYWEDGGPDREKYLGVWSGLETRLVLTPMQAIRLTVGGEVQRHFRASYVGAFENGGTYIDRNDPFTVLAGYVLADAKASDQLHASAGARIDSYPTLGFGSSVNPRVALVAHPYSRGTIKLMGGKAFRAPSVYERTYNDGGLTIAVSPNLRPETIYSPELEFSHRFTSSWTGLVTGYGNYIRDLIVPIGDGVPGAPMSLVNSSAPVLILGAESEVRREWRQGWMVGFSYSYQKARYQQEDDPSEPKLREVPNSPNHLASFKGAVPIIPRVLTGATRISFEGARFDRYDREGDPPQQKNEPFVVWDFVLTGEASRSSIRYALGIYNAFDWRYSFPVGRDVPLRMVPQAGRTVLASISTTL